MELRKGLFCRNFPCPECPTCRSRPDSGGFHKILEHDDDVSIYRYKSPELSYLRRKEEPREIFIFETAKKAVELNLDIFTKEFDKCKNYCPRCKEMMRRAEKLLKDLPSFHKGGVRSLCGHINLGDHFHCAPCKAIVEKFLKNTTQAQRDPERTRLHTYLDRSAIKENPTKSETVKSAIAPQINETAETKIKRKQKEAKTVKENVPPKLKGAGTLISAAKSVSKIKLTRYAESSRTKQQSLQERSKKKTEDKNKKEDKKKEEVKKKEEGNNKEEGRKKEGRNKEEGRKKDEGLKVKSVNKLAKSKVELKKNQTNKATQTYDNKSINLMRFLIAQQLKEKLEIESKKREHETHKRGLEKQAIEAEKKNEATDKKLQSVLERQSLLEKQACEDVISLVHEPYVIEECAHKPDSVHCVVRGEKIIKTVADQVRERETPLDPKRQRSPEVQQPSTQVPQRSAEVPQPSQQVPPPPPSPHSLSSQQGVLRYSLSNRNYIKKGWTLLPQEKILRQTKMYQMRPARPDMDWFELNRHRRHLEYDSGELLATFDGGTSARVYYRSGDVALDYYAAEEVKAGRRLVLYSNTDRDRAVLAVFDYAGNGVVFDHAGNVRLKYDQNEGVMLDSKLGPKTHWKWHNLNEAPKLRTVVADNQLPFKDPQILKLGEDVKDDKSQVTQIESDENMVFIEAQNASNDEIKSMKRKFTPYQLRMKALKINEYFSLRIIEQSAVYLVYSDGRNRLKINMGLVLDPMTILGYSLSELGDVGNPVEKLPAGSASVEKLHKIVRRTRTKARLRVARERRLNPDLVGSRSLSSPLSVLPCGISSFSDDASRF